MGTLTVVGTGIAVGVHLTPEARTAIEDADEFFHIASDRVGTGWLESLHPRPQGLHGLYEPGVPRHEIYAQMVETILAPVRAGRRVCAAFYGHPGIYVVPSHEAVRKARDEGFDARMLPAVSAEDCLFADLGVDPATSGCASYEATDFLLRRRPVDPTVTLLLWQISVVGNLAAATEVSRDGLVVLVGYLGEHYPPEHVVTVYEASPYPIAGPVIEPVALAALPDADLTPLSTLYVPPLRERPVDGEMAVRLGLPDYA
ncbi:MAG: SAM-dependent methyltransferase [Actinomycetota bacterium]